VAAERFLDTNILLRHLLRDHLVHSPAAAALLKRIEAGTEDAWTSSLAIAEIVWVLSGPQYQLSRPDIRDGLSPLCSMTHLRVEHAEAVQRALDRFAQTNLDFIDCLNAALVEQHDLPELYSFDRDFDRIPEVTRIEPRA
jgi:predicted nucleic acid-binding protein